jgi:polyisoprenoid-binding protein YceI
MHTAAIGTTLAVTLAGAPVLAQAAAYDIDPSHSSATFKVRHLMVSNVRGELGRISGKVVIDEGDVTRSTVEASIDASTINTRDEKRDEHLRSPDFLDVKKHPTITFKSKRVRKGRGTALLVTGDLTIRGVTRETTLEVDALAPEVRDPWGNLKRGASATTKINRKDFGMSFNIPLDGGGVVVGDEVSINLEVELGRKAATAAAEGR